MMKLLLCIALLLLAAQLSESACIRLEPNTNAAGESQESDVCIDTVDDSVHEVGESWNVAICLICTCDTTGYQCCDRAIRPTLFSEICEAVLDPEACVYRVQLKVNPSIECPTFGAVGK